MMKGSNCTITILLTGSSLLNPNLSGGHDALLGANLGLCISETINWC